MMRLYRKKDGFTLIELLIVILTGTIVTAAATTILLLAMRINRKSLDTVERQSIMRIMQSVFEDMGSDGDYVFSENAITKKTEDNTVGDPIISFKNNKIVTGKNGDSVLMEDVDGFGLSETPTPFDDVNGLYTFSIDSRGKQYISSVYGRTQDAGWDADSPTLEYEAGRETLVEVAASQLESRGKIDRIDDWYTKWYVDTYVGKNVFDENNTDIKAWSKYTPWCCTFVSWALRQCNNAVLDEEDKPILYIKNVPQESNVNYMWLQFYIGEKTGILKSYEESETLPPEPGDLIFFVDRNEATDVNLLPNVLAGADVEKIKTYLQWDNGSYYIVPLAEFNINSIDIAIFNENYKISRWISENDPPENYVKYNIVKHYFNGARPDLSLEALETYDGLDHIGIVVNVTDTHVYTIEGNVVLADEDDPDNIKDHSVMLRKYPLDNDKSAERYQIYGYATLNWNEAYK